MQYLITYPNIKALWNKYNSVCYLVCHYHICNSFIFARWRLCWGFSCVHVCQRHIILLRSAKFLLTSGTVQLECLEVRSWKCQQGNFNLWLWLESSVSPSNWGCMERHKEPSANREETRKRFLRVMRRLRHVKQHLPSRQMQGQLKVFQESSLSKGSPSRSSVRE